MKRFVFLFLVILAAALLVLPYFYPKGGLHAQSTGGHSVTLSWTASTSAAGCTSPCTFGYSVFRGATSGGENTQLNSSPITTTSYVDSSITLTSSTQTFYYYVEAVETSSGITVNSAPSNEVSVTFPGIPAAPTALTGVGH